MIEVTIPEGARESQAIRVPGSGAVKITVGKNARVCIVQELSGPSPPAPLPEGEGGLSSDVEVIVEEGAHVEFISINRMSSDVPVKIQQRSHVADNATIRWRNVTLGAGAVDHDLRSELAGADAVSEVDWMFYAKDDEKYRLSARNIFTGRQGSGEITMKGVAEEKGHVKCDGMIEIGKGGAGTDTYLTQDVLMLDKTSKVDAIPGLEIKTNDVRASHSATVSKVTDEDLFYFAARGIVEKEARQMFVEGFLGDLIAKIGSASEREEVMNAVAGKYAS